MAEEKLIGGCDCGHVRYEMNRSPLFVHCCHCLWCQRESGAAFAINALIESSEVQVTNNQPKLIDTPSESGKGQQIARCPKCQVAVWSHYAGFGPSVSFIKVGTLDQPNQLPPDIHIFTKSKQNWVQLSDQVPVSEFYYETKKLWPENSLNRLKALKKNQQH